MDSYPPVMPGAESTYARVQISGASSVLNLDGSPACVDKREHDSATTYPIAIAVQLNLAIARIIGMVS